MTPIEQELLDLIDSQSQGMSLSVIIKLAPHLAIPDIKVAINSLYDNRRINRLSVKGDNERFYYVFYSLFVRTVVPFEESEPIPVPRFIPVADQAQAEAPAPELIPEPAPAAPISTEEAIEVLRRAGWTPQGEVVERRVIDTGVARLDPLAVIDRWKLSYRLSRIIEIVGGARKNKLTKSDAAMVARLAREEAL